MSVKINTLEIENTKRIKAVKMICTPDGLTVIGGRNGQGKTTVLDAIVYALGGEKYKPSQIKREGSQCNPEIKLTLSNGIVVERKGTNSTLKVTDPAGNKAGQALLNEFIPVFALDLPKFMNSTDKEKAQTLLQIIGVGQQLAELEAEEKRLYNERHTQGQIADQKKKYADEMRDFPDVEQEAPVTATELIHRQQAILARNGENQMKRNRVAQLQTEVTAINAKVQSLAEQLAQAQVEQTRILNDFSTAQKTAEQLTDESTAAIEADLAAIDELNTKIRANLDKAHAQEEAAKYSAQYDTLTNRIDEARAKKMALLNGANLPLPNLSIEDGELVYNGQRWDCMSGSEQLRVATAIVRRLNPECGFVLVDKLEQMDMQTLQEFGAWVESEGLQVIATRVSTGGECSVIIEDGYGELVSATDDIEI